MLGRSDLEVRLADLLRTARTEAGLTQRDLAAAANTSQSAIARYESGKSLPTLRTLSRLVRACGARIRVEVVGDETGTPRGRTGKEGAVRRPVAVPKNLDDPAVEKAAGVVTLPLSVQWSEPGRNYDLSERRDRIRIYEQVLREGTEEDVKRFVRADDLVDLWDELVLPAYVRDAWEERIAEYREARAC